MDQVPKAVFFMSGDAHHKVKRLIDPAFSQRMLKNMIPVFEAKSKLVIKQWLEEFDKVNPCKIQLAIQVEDYLNRLVLDAICETVLEFDMNAVSFPDTNEVELLTRALTPDNRASVISSVIPVYRYLPLPAIRHCRKGEKFLKDIVKNKLSDKRQKLSENLKSSVDEARNVLSRLVTAKDELGNPLPDDLVVEIVIGLLAAGFLTTGHTLTWTMLQLALYPDVQTLVRQEIKEVVPEHCENITIDILNKMQYLQCVIKETLRLYPSLSNTSRIAINDDYIDGMHIPAGTMIVMDLGTLHRMDDNWNEPEKFIPERFMQETKPYTYLPFLAGPYMCIGHKYGMLQIATVVCCLLREFEFSVIPNTTFRKKLVELFLIKPQPDLVLNVKQIK